MLGLDPAWDIILRRKAPLVKVLDVREDTTDLTTYTFTNCNICLGSAQHDLAYMYGTQAHVRSSGHRNILVVIHAEDATTTFGVASVTIGGVAGTEDIDRGGGTNAINTAIYRWASGALDTIANSDIVVTFSEAVTACAIGVLAIENIGLNNRVSGSASTATGTLSDTIAANLTLYETHPYCIIGLTCATGTGGTELSQSTADTSSTGSGQVSHMFLYEGHNAEIDYACWWTYLPQYPGGNVPFRVVSAWSGTGAGDQAAHSYL